MEILIAALAYSILSGQAFATPSTTFWAPSTAGCQDFAVPHVTYDTYFAQGPVTPRGAPVYPIDTGLTAGFLPGEKLQGEIGYDLLFPSASALFLNGKLCLSESAFFNGFPGVSFGIFDFGFKTDVTNFNVLHLMIQKTIPGMDGYLAIGIYHGLNRTLFTNSDGQVVQTGMMIGASSPDIHLGLTGLKKINFAADIQTGKNVLGAWGFGPYLYFTDDIDLLTGPVFFLDRNLQPGGQSFFWTAQLDVNIRLTAAK